VEAAITLNLPVEDWLAQMIIMMMALAIFFSYGLQFYVPLELILPSLKQRVQERWHLPAEYLLRFTLVLITFLLAAAIPILELFISLVGAASSSTLALMAPPLIHLMVNWEDFKGTKGKILILRNVFLFMVGFIGFITGTYVTLGQIINYFVTGHLPGENTSNSTMAANTTLFKLL